MKERKKERRIVENEDTGWEWKESKKKKNEKQKERKKERKSVENKMEI